LAELSELDPEEVAAMRTEILEGMKLRAALR
jgi:hypothetical protein